jgi:addiction module RelB/DinJ family antitoxin
VPPLKIHRFDKWATFGPHWVMSAIAKSRIDPELKRQAEAVLKEIGLKPRAALELFYKQIVKRRAIPFPVQADSPEDAILSPAARRNRIADEF